MEHTSDDCSRAGNRTICPDCRARVDADAVRCPSCGARFPAMQDRQGAPGRAMLRMVLVPLALVLTFVTVGVFGTFLQADSRPDRLQLCGALVLLVVALVLDYLAWLYYKHPAGYP